MIARPRLAAALATVALVGAGLAGILATAAPAAGWPSPRLTLVGHGNGTGVGLSEEGAYGYATNYGWNSTQILGHYYGGSVRSVGLAPVDVDLVARGAAWLRVTSTAAAFRIDNITVPAGYSALLTHTASGYVVQVASSCGGQYGVARPVHSTVFSSTVSAPTSLDQLLRLCGSADVYRGSLVMVPGYVAADYLPFRVVNRLSVDDYLRSALPGELSDVDQAWFTAANSQAWLESLAIAARTLVVTSRTYPWANVTADQALATGNFGYGTYLGAGRAPLPGDSPVAAAVQATSSRLLVNSAGTAVVHAVLSRSSGGWTAGGGFPVVQDLGDAVSTSHNWRSAFELSFVSSQLGGTYGTLQRITFTRSGVGDYGGRVLRVTLVGDRGSLTVTGDRFRDRLALRSNWFAVSTFPPAVHLSNELSQQPPVDLGETFGRPGDQPIACDFDGDHADSVAVYRASTGTFYIRNSVSSTAPYYTVQLGTAGDIAVCGDWDGDGIDTVGVFDPRTSRFYLINSVTRTAGTPLIQVQFGGPGVQPVAGDWDGDGRTTLGVWDQRTQYFYLINSLAPGAARSRYYQADQINATPIAGNWGVNGRDSYGFWYGTSSFLELFSEPGGPLQAVATFGEQGSVPVIGDWNGDGTDTIGYGTDY
jgi:peptidoglycan hydrolase-like amidase